MEEAMQVRAMMPRAGNSTWWPACVFFLVSACSLGTPPPVVTPGKAGHFAGTVGWGFPYARARARVRVPTGINAGATSTVKDITGNAASLAAAFDDSLVLSALGAVSDLRIAGFFTPESHLTLAGDLSWHRAGLGLHLFFDPEATRSQLKLATGVRLGTFERELWGWFEFGWTLRLSRRWQGYLALQPSAGRFRHWLHDQQLLPPPTEEEEGGWPSPEPAIDLFRPEIRVAVPLGAVVQGNRNVAFTFLASPYVTVVHGTAKLHNCIGCNNVELLDFKQYGGVSFDLYIQWR